MIKASNLAFSFNNKLLFEEASFIVGKGQKVGLVGANGAGKTTLMNLLVNKEEPTYGKIEIIGTIGLVPQEVKRDEAMEEASSIRNYLDKQNDRNDYELRIMLHGLELDKLNLDASPKNLSGGQKTKLALAKALLEQPEILLLDEPTNFMDVEGKKWVMEFLSGYTKTLILISHDMDLMDNSIDKVLFINNLTQRVEEYKGNYTKFKQLKAEKEALEKRHILAEQKHIKSMEKGLKRMKFTSKKGVRARVRLTKRIERMKDNLPELPKEIKSIKINLPEPLPVGELILKAAGIYKSYGTLKVLNNVNLSILRGQRIALIGPNGIGKSTLIKIIMGLIDSDAGEIYKNPNLKVGYYSQEFETLNMEKSLFETIVETCHVDDSYARSLLGRFNFKGDKVFQKVATLSGGEKTRLAIAALAGSNHNLLILDEPTTYLDVLSQRVILDTLKEYRGTMIVVSHTGEFISELSPDKAFLLPENKMVFWSDELLTKVSEI